MLMIWTKDDLKAFMCLVVDQADLTAEPQKIADYLFNEFVDETESRLLRQVMDALAQKPTDEHLN